MDERVFNEPPGLGERGSRLWQELYREGTPEVERALIDELARTADRLDELDSIIQGKGVLNLMQFRVDAVRDEEGGDRNVNVEVKFNAVLAEARQQSASLAGLVKSLEAVKGKKESAPARPGVLPGNVTPIGESPLQRLLAKQNS